MVVTRISYLLQIQVCFFTNGCKLKSDAFGNMNATYICNIVLA